MTQMKDFFNTAVGKTVKEIIRVSLAAGVASLAAASAKDPTLFGTYTVTFSALFMLIEKILTPSVKNI